MGKSAVDFEHNVSGVAIASGCSFSFFLPFVTVVQPFPAPVSVMLAQIDLSPFLADVVLACRGPALHVLA